MTPIEKATSLIETFKPIIRMKMGQDVDTKAKECALVVADELIKSCPSIKEESWHELLYEKYSEYWQEVKQEIKKL